MSSPEPLSAPAPVTRKSSRLYLQVLVAVILGALLGHLRPTWGAALKPLADGFIRLITMLVGPIVFCTVVTGIAHLGDLKRVGRVGLKALLYFEAVTTLSLAIGLGVGELWKPGLSAHVTAPANTHALDELTSKAHTMGVVDFLLNIIPKTVVSAFVNGEMLQVLLVAVLVGIAAAGLGERGHSLVAGVDTAGKVLFRVVGLVMVLAPLGAFGAMAFTVGTYGLASLRGLLSLMACFYVTSILFVGVVLGLICRALGISLLKLLRLIGDELWLVLGTSSSESALPGVMAKLEQAGVGPSVVGLVIPMGYSFNLDGTSIYLTLATLFVAQATGTHVSLGEELGLLGILLLTSKGAATVTGGGFVTLAATLSVTGHIPVSGLALLLGVDRFMSEARALVNLCGNSVATLVVAKWEGELDAERIAQLAPATRARSPRSSGGG